MREFFEKAAMQNHPLRVLQDFLETEERNQTAKNYDSMRFVGYVLDIGFDTVTIITSDPFKLAVGGVPRNSLLIMLPSLIKDLPPHFTLLRVLESAPTPLSREMQQTYFELQKKSMPELDIFTQSELQWGALKTGILGMFYPHQDNVDEVEFSGDINNFVSAHKYLVYAPDNRLLNLIINSVVPKENRFSIGKLRLTECRLPLPGKPQPDVSVLVSTRDFMGMRTAMFGKTRLGKSNVVKLIAQSLIETTKDERNVGQLIFDIDGEYANDNPQDGSRSLASIYKERCTIYALTKKEKTDSRPLRLDFYEHPEGSHAIIRSLLKERANVIYISSFLSVEIPSIKSLEELPVNEKLRAQRKILMYWAILHKAGYTADSSKLVSLLGSLNPKFSQPNRDRVYNTPGYSAPVNTLDQLVAELEAFTDADRASRLISSSGKQLFYADDLALLGFLKPTNTVSAGPKVIQNFRKYHDPKAGDFVVEVLELLSKGDTVILDLGNAPPEVMQYFSNLLSEAVFYRQVDRFSNNDLGSHYLQLYFEEAHNLFPNNSNSREVDIYQRIAKEGGKYHIGMVYSTQSVTTVSKDLLAQTENFFIAHMSSQDEVNALAKVNIAYESLKNDILQAKRPGYIRMLTRSNRFVVPVQATLFAAPIVEGG